jgi:ribosomal-protein-alanine N-acetyltransferase
MEEQAKKKFITRSMTFDDLPSIMAIENVIFADPWKEEMFYYEIEMKESYVLEDVSNNRIVAYLCGVAILDEYMITNIAVEQDKQSRGYASYLISSVLDKEFKSGCKNCYLEVRISNNKAIRLYEKLGFETMGIRKAYYSNPVEDAYLMKCNLLDNYDKIAMYKKESAIK